MNGVKRMHLFKGRAVVACSAVALAAMSSCGTEPEPTETRRAAPATATALLEGAHASTLVVGGDDDAFVYGGVASDGTVTRDGVIVDAQGVVLSFRTPVALHQPAAVFGEDAITVVGTACEGKVTIHDTGTSCSPGTAAAFRVSLDDGSVTEVNLGPLDPNPDVETYATALALDGQVVVQIVQDGTPTLRRVRATGSEQVEAPPGIVACSTQDAMYAVAAPTSGPSGPSAPVTAVEPPPTANPTVHRYTSATGWSTIPADVPLGQLLCTEHQLVVLTDTGTRYVLDGDQGASSDTTAGYGSSVITNPSDSFYAASADGVTFEVVDADGGAARTVTVSGNDGSALLALLSGGRLTSVTEGRLEDIG